MNDWARKALRGAEFVASPALAGAAFCLLAVGVVTWLPALAAAAHTLQDWRTDGSGRCFTGTLRAFPRQWRRLRREALVSTALLLLCVSNTIFLLGRGGPVLVLLPVQGVVFLALAVYGVSLAAVSAVDQDSDARQWRRTALAFAFGSPRRTLVLAGALVVLPVAVAPVPLGPLLLGPTLPLLLALSLRAPADPRRTA